MTAREIEASKREHDAMLRTIRILVQYNTPSRVGKKPGYRRGLGYVFEAYDYARGAWVHPA
jgi:hypothetical protein